MTQSGWVSAASGSEAVRVTHPTLPPCKGEAGEKESAKGKNDALVLQGSGRPMDRRVRHPHRLNNSG